MAKFNRRKLGQILQWVSTFIVLGVSLTFLGTKLGLVEEGKFASLITSIDPADYGVGVTASGPVTLADLQALEDAAENIVNAQIAAGAAIDGSKLADNSITRYKPAYRAFLDSLGINWSIPWNAISDTTLRKIITIGAINSMNIDSLFAADALDSARWVRLYDDGGMLITSTQMADLVIDDGEVPLDKLEYNVPFFSGNSDSCLKMAWGKVKLRALDVPPGDSTWFKVTFADCTQTGDPNFDARPFVYWSLMPLPGTKQFAGANVAALWAHFTADSAAGWVYPVTDTLEGTIQLNFLAVEP